ncbi:MAG TPA: glycosyltransferase family 4 protein, partial [Burkholderiales bacterium]|nr:glycosyltransferase family 4 protein [Burkholderiales bacterium]
VCVVAPPESRIIAETRRRGIPARCAPIARKGLRGLWALRRIFGERGVDVVNSHSSTDSWLSALALRTLSGAPSLVRTRHVSAAIPGHALNRWLYGNATAHVVTTGERLREQVMRETGLDATRVSSVPTGINLGHFVPGERLAARARLELPADAFVVGIVATLRSWKGHRYLVDAVASMPGVVLVMVGDGPGADNLRAQVKGRGIESRVRMPGNQDDVVPWLQAFDVFALPSYANEGVPQAIMQAMACGIPVIATDIGSIGEVVQDGRTGLIVPPQDADMLRRAIERVADDGALRQRLTGNALALARERFSDARMLDEMERIFREAVAARPRRC